MGTGTLAHSPQPDRTERPSPNKTITDLLFGQGSQPNWSVTGSFPSKTMDESHSKRGQQGLGQLF